MKWATRVQCNCVICGQSFEVNESRLKYGAGKFCSLECNRASKRKQVPRECKHCGTAFSLSPSKLNRVGAGQYCSRRCAAANSPRRPAADRFWEKVAVAGVDECWLWQGSLCRNGYGRMYSGDHVPMGAHRFSWEIHHGSPGSLCVLHKCDVPRCVNPAHLFLGSLAENSADMRTKGRSKTGESHHNAKLTEKIVLECRRRYASGERSMRSLAFEYGVQPQAMRDAVQGFSWRHI